MSHEPIFWSSTSQSNDPDRTRERMVNGKRIREKVPQIGHDGEYDNRRPARGVRYVTVVRHEGHTVAMVLTNAAAHLDTSTTFAAYQRAKMRHLGWFALGACPVALLATGDLMSDHLVDQSLIGQVPCERGSYNEQKPCPHCLAELTARRKNHAEYEAEQMPKFAEAAQKQVDAMQDQAAAMREQTEALTKLIMMNAQAATPTKKTEPNK